MPFHIGCVLAMTKRRNSFIWRRITEQPSAELWTPSCTAIDWKSEGVSAVIDGGKQSNPLHYDIQADSFSHFPGGGPSVRSVLGGRDSEILHPPPAPRLGACSAKMFHKFSATQASCSATRVEERSGGLGYSSFAVDHDPGREEAPQS